MIHTFLQQLQCGYGFPLLIHVWIASACMLELFISMSGEATMGCIQGLFAPTFETKVIIHKLPFSMDKKVR